MFCRVLLMAYFSIDSECFLTSPAKDWAEVRLVQTQPHLPALRVRVRVVRRPCPAAAALVRLAAVEGRARVEAARPVGNIQRKKTFNGSLGSGEVMMNRLCTMAYASAEGGRFSITFSSLLKPWDTFKVGKRIVIKINTKEVAVEPVFRRPISRPFIIH